MVVEILTLGEVVSHIRVPAPVAPTAEIPASAPLMKMGVVTPKATLGDAGDQTATSINQRTRRDQVLLFILTCLILDPNLHFDSQVSR